MLLDTHFSGLSHFESPGNAPFGVRGSVPGPQGPGLAAHGAQEMGARENTALWGQGHRRLCDTPSDHLHVTGRSCVEWQGAGLLRSQHPAQPPSQALQCHHHIPRKIPAPAPPPSAIPLPGGAGGRRGVGPVTPHVGGRKGRWEEPCEGGDGRNRTAFSTWKWQCACRSGLSAPRSPAGIASACRPAPCCCPPGGGQAARVRR